MNELRHALERHPVTIAVAIAYLGLGFATGLFGQSEDFAQQVERFGLLRPMLVADGEPWRLLAHAFLHGGVLHLGFNFLMLWALGPALEAALGSWRFALLYAVSAIGGGLGACLLYDPRQGLLGGSGALFGMMGAAVAVNMRAGRHLLAFLEFEGPRRLLGMIVANLVLGMVLPMVSNTAHVGGLVTGFAVTLLWLRPLPASPSRRHWRLATAALFFTALAWSLAPVTRFDWLYHRAQRTQGDERERLLRAALQARPDAFVPVPDGDRRR